MSSQDTASFIIDEVVERVLGPYVWMRSFLLGEFEPEKDLSVLVAQALANFVPGLVIVFSARDAVAIAIRMARYPEKRDDPLEWIFLCACLIVVALPVAMAAGGAVLAGIGSVFGAALGSELGAALKAIVLLLMNKTANLADILLFLQKFMKGNLTGLLKQIKFKQFEDALVSTLKSILAKLIEICVGLRRHYDKHTHLHEVRNTIEKLRQWEASFYALQTAGIKNIPLALAELDARLAVVLTQVGVKEMQAATAGVRAGRPTRPAIETQRVYASVGSHPRDAREATAPSAGRVAEGKKPTVKRRATSVAKTAEGPNAKRQVTAETVPRFAADRVVMRSPSELMGVEPASAELLAAVGAKRSLVIAQPGSDELRMLDYFGAEASVNGVNNSSILLRQNPSKAAVLEEFLHGTQSRLGIVDRLGTSGLGSAETHVKDFMMRHQSMLGLSAEDVRILRILRDEGL